LLQPHPQPQLLLHPQPEPPQPPQQQQMMMMIRMIQQQPPPPPQPLLPQHILIFTSLVLVCAILCGRTGAGSAARRKYFSEEI